MVDKNQENIIDKIQKSQLPGEFNRGRNLVFELMKMKQDAEVAI